MNTEISYKISRLIEGNDFEILPHLKIDDENLRNLNSNYSPKEYQPWYFDVTTSDVVMWMKEKYGVWIFVEPDCYGENWYGKISICSKDVWDNTDLRSQIMALQHKLNLNEHKKPSSAYEEVISVFLTTII